MAVERYIAVLPCYSIEDIAKDLSEAEVASFHVAWTSLWHPLFLSQNKGLPEWKRKDGNSLSVENALVVVPEQGSSATADAALDTSIRERLLAQNCTVVSIGSDRDVALQSILRELSTIDPPSASEEKFPNGFYCLSHLSRCAGAWWKRFKSKISTHWGWRRYLCNR
jgi:hypothetical protein